jgi:hypothetical protein
MHPEKGVIVYIEFCYQNISVAEIYNHPLREIVGVIL